MTPGEQRIPTPSPRPEHHPDGAVLVTGAAGFIGRALTERLRSLGVEVRGVDVTGAGVTHGSVTEPSAWRGALAGVDTVVHAAAIVSNVVPTSRMHAVNVVGTARVLDAAHEAGVRRVVHLSSVTVHGHQLPTVVDEYRPLRTTGDAYIDTKITGEHLALAAHARGELEVVVVRPGDVYGPGSRPWVVLPLTYLAAGQAVLPVRGAGLLSPVHLDDLVDGVLAAASVADASGGIFHVTGGVGVRCDDYFGRLGAMVGRRPRRAPTGLATAAAAAMGTAQRAVGRPSELCAASMRMLSRTGTYATDRARAVLGVTPRVDLDRGLAEVERWARTTGLIGGR